MLGRRWVDAEGVVWSREEFPTAFSPNIMEPSLTVAPPSLSIYPYCSFQRNWVHCHEFLQLPISTLQTSSLFITLTPELTANFRGISSLSPDCFLHLAPYLIHLDLFQDWAQTVECKGILVIPLFLFCLHPWLNCDSRALWSSSSCWIFCSQSLVLVPPPLSPDILGETPKSVLYLILCTQSSSTPSQHTPSEILAIPLA